MTTVPLQEASKRLPELIEGLAPGDVLVITKNDRPIAHLVPASERPAEKPRRRSGSMKGSVLYMADDLDAPLEDFQECME